MKHLDDARDHLRRNARQLIDTGSGPGPTSSILDSLALDRSQAPAPAAL